MNNQEKTNTLHAAENNLLWIIYDEHAGNV